MKKYFVYIVECSNGAYYTGVINDIIRRLNEHNEGTDRWSYTYNKRPVKLVFQYEFNDINQAIAFEKQIKGWTRKKKEALINDNWDELKILAVCKNDTHYSNKGKNEKENN